MRHFWFEAALLPGGWAEGVRIAVAGRHIAAVETGVAPSPGDEPHAVALPGTANLHSHAFQRAMAGLAEHRGPAQDSFWTWRDAMYRFANAIGPEELEAIAAMAFVEMLEAGFTSVAEFHYLHHDREGRPYDNPAEMGMRLAAAAEVTGIGLVLLPVLYCTGGFGGAAPKREQRRFINDVDGYARLLEACRAAARVGVAPHSLRAVPRAELEQLLSIVDADTPIHIHIAEQVGEVEDCLSATGRRPIAWLLDHAPVDERWCLVHATHAEPEELRGIAARGAVVGLCPITEANLGDGIFPAAAFLEAGGRFGVGSDSNVLIDLAGELRGLEYSQRLIGRARNVLSLPEHPSTGRLLFERAGAGGAQALGQHAFGLAVGGEADFVTLDLSHPTLAGKRGDLLLDAFVFAHRGNMIDGVWCGGRQLVSGGRHIAREHVAQRFVATVASLSC